MVRQYLYILSLALCTQFSQIFLLVPRNATKLTVNYNERLVVLFTVPKSMKSSLIVIFLLLQVEYMILKFDHENKKVQVSLRGNELLETLQQKELNNEPK